MLFLAILSSTLVSVFMRLGSGGGETRKPMLMFNYVVCVAVSALFLNRSAAGGGMGTALGYGLVGGVLYLGAFLLFQENVKKNGVTLSSAFMKLGVTVPTVLGFILFREPVSAIRIGGIALTLIAIAMLSGRGDSSRDAARPGLGMLVALLLLGGMADGLSKFYAAYGNPDLEGHFLLFVFGFALVLCAVVCLVQHQKPTRRDMLFGLLIGIPNYFSSRFLLLALNDIPASTAYPVFSCGTILLSALAGRALFSERPGARQYVSLALILAALILLNL